MHMVNINQDIAANDRQGIEEAFRALVGWPNRIDGSTPATRHDALKACCEALKGNTGILPRGIAELIEEPLGEPVLTYEEGAEAVRDLQSYWKARLARAG